MHVALLALTLQLRISAATVPAQHPAFAAADSLRDLVRARNAQAAFERSRRQLLPVSYGSGGRCDVRLGRFCWWYDEYPAVLPPEVDAIGHRRGELLGELDAVAAHAPGDDWIAGMRVHYRIDGRDFAGADSVARSCRGTNWWCGALVGYAAHMRGNEAASDSAFTAAIAAMPPDTACAWRDVSPLLIDDDREIYLARPCAARVDIETRYWLLSRPQLASAANEWKNDYNVRRVLVRLAEHSLTPYSLTWGDDARELVLRYGWPIAWSRLSPSTYSATEPGIIGHDPSPSFTFAPTSTVSDSTRALTPDAWDFNVIHGESRFAPRLVRRIGSVSAQFARFRRGDSTLVVAAYAANDDSLLAPIGFVAAARSDSGSVAGRADTSRVGRGRVMIAGKPMIAGVEVLDTVTHTLARGRVGFVPLVDTARVALSDLLFYRAGELPAESLDSALTRAIPGDTVTQGRPVGIFWETYGLIADGETVDVAVTVERVDHSWIRSSRQRLGLTPMDTPIRMRWTDARPAAGQSAARAVSLGLENLDAGRYRVSLTMTPVGGSPTTTAREFELRNP